MVQAVESGPTVRPKKAARLLLLRVVFVGIAMHMPTLSSPSYEGGRCCLGNRHQRMGAQVVYVDVDQAAAAPLHLALESEATSPGVPG